MLNFHASPNGQVPVDESSATLGQFSVGSHGSEKSLTSKKDGLESELTAKRSLCARIAHPLTSTVRGIYNKTVTTALHAETTGYEKGGFLLGKPMKIIGGLCGLGYGVLTSLPMFAQGIARAYQGNFEKYEGSLKDTGKRQNFYRKETAISQLNATKPLWFKGSIGNAIEKMSVLKDNDGLRVVDGITKLDFMLNFYLLCSRGGLDLNDIVGEHPELREPLMVLLKAVEDESQVYQLINDCYLTGEPDVQNRNDHRQYVADVYAGRINLDSESKIRELRQSLKQN
ncbi:hypothetical protein GZ78_16300 [Endozoicomonas numazuensis]|uniref:Uncharacterized protein n=2 Tax=Endozoicomonas numazuensis TaxID=1137799 RepID=A0A081NFY8_9GAMM|nr:hypothetical protein GZ78_16300 [Endozoicomonas numazuensis]